MRKGITPIISIIVLLLITVALAGAAYTYLSSYMTTYTEKSFIVISGSEYCDSGGTIHMRIKNMGSTTITQADFIERTATSGGTESTFTINDINPKVTSEITCDCGGSCASGTYSIRLGTTAGVQSYTVTC